MPLARMLAGLLLVCVAVGAWAQSFPALSGRVVDQAGILTPATVAAITERSAAVEAATGIQAVAVTVADLQGYPIEEYGYRLGRHWGIGTRDRNDGILLIVAPNERRVRIEVGYGLEPYVTDALAIQLIRREILPRFREGDLDGGTRAGFEALADQLVRPETERAAALEAAAAERASGRADGAGILPFLLFLFILWLVLGSMKRRGRRFGGTSGPIIIWGPGWGTGSWGSGHGGWGGGGGGFGGGGFSGGGGGFGGGGASGGW